LNFTAKGEFNERIFTVGITMPDKPRIRRQQNRSRINLGEDYEVEYWATSLGVSKERLVEVVKKVGDSVQAVRTEIMNTR